MATRVWELLGNVEDGLLQEAVVWIEQEGLLLETERVGEVAAAAEVVCCSELAAAAETEAEKHLDEEKEVAVCCELQQTQQAAAEEPLETERVEEKVVVVCCSELQPAAGCSLQQTEWPALPCPTPAPTRLSLPPPLPKLQAAATRCSKPKQPAAAAAGKPRQSRIQHLLQNPALLDSLPQPTVVLQRMTLFGKSL